MFGLVQEVPQRESTPFYPRSPYGVAKLYAHWITTNYRESYGMFTCNGILFNHESPRRGETFVTRKITMAACNIVLGFQDVLYLGNLDAKRDWGHARDYVRAMHLMLQQERPDDFVISSGKTTSVREFMVKSFEYLGINLDFNGDGANEVAVVKGIDSGRWNKLGIERDAAITPGQVVMRIDPKYYRPAEVDLLIGDSSKAKTQLGWFPEFKLDQLISDMMQSDLLKIKKKTNNTSN